MNRIFLAALIMVSTVCANALSQTSPKKTTLSRADFEKILIERAVPDSLATDTLGAWINVYQYILQARAVDRQLYEKALLQLQGTDNCIAAGVEEAARLSCAANNAADAAASLTIFAAAVEFRQDAVAYAERIADRNPAPLLDALIDLVSDERSYGSLAEAERAFGRAGDLMAAKPDLADLGRRFRLAIMTAQFADARLDDAAALKAFTSAIEAVEEDRSRPVASDRFKLNDESMTELVSLHLRGRFCQGCGVPIAEPAQRWIDKLAGTSFNDNPSFVLAHPRYAGLLLALAAPDRAVSPTQIKAYVGRYLKRYPMDADIRQRLPPRIDDLGAARLLALASLVAESGPGEPKTALSFLVEPDERRQIALGRQLIAEMVEQFREFGGDRAIATTLDDLSRRFQAFGLNNPAQLTLQFLADRRVGADAAEFRLEKSRRASLYAPVLARLASLKLRRGDQAAALSNLDEAGTLAASKLNDEWASGGAGAILALRDLAPTLRLIAQKRSEIVAPRGVSSNGAGHDALFRSMQSAVFGETALAVAVSNQRRLTADATVQHLRHRHLSAIAAADRATQIAALNYEAGDVDGALARQRTSAEDRRDALTREVRAVRPDLFAGAADLQPVPLADAAAKLADGEALVVLHVGSHGIHGFLVDGKRQSHAWRSVVRREAVDALVRSIRAGGDVSRGAFPPFPFADAGKLHDLIFGPVKGHLGAYRKLLVVGDGPLQAMPYGVLLTKPVDGTFATPDALRAASPPWLIRSHAVALLPSVRSLVAQRSGTMPSQAAKPFLGIGNPQLADATGGVRNIDVSGAFGGSRTGLADVSVLRRLVSLPETGDELRAIATLLRSPVDTLMLGAQANEKAVRKAALADYRIVAFATHGALAGEVTGTSEPGLVLTPPAEASREDDGFLALSEIAGLRFDADLVMLSACNTAASDGRPRAEGLSGLARGFFDAGARSLLVTHWAIPSEASVKITTGLVATRSERPDIDWADALRDATLAVIDREGPGEWAHPAYWGGFAVVGVLSDRHADDGRRPQ